MQFLVFFDLFFTNFNGVAMYGGFAGDETSRDQRDTVTNETILSGDLAGDDVQVADPRDLLDEPTRAENSYHVVTGSGIDETAVLDGFTITAGNANGSDTYDRGGGMYSTGSSPTLTNCTFSGNAAGADPITTAGDDGGGMYSIGDPTLTNCTFIDNSADDQGGGMCNRLGNPILTNCTFSGNSAQSAAGMYNRGGIPTLTNCIFSGNSASPFGYGGGMYNHYSSPVLINCTFSGNSAGLTGGIHNVWNGDPTLTNCILWGNSDPGGMDESAQISTSAPRIPVINYSCIQGWTGTGPFSGTDNIGDDPLFVDADGSDDIFGTEDDDLRLSAGSPCIDAGNNSALLLVAGYLPTDMDGDPRLFDDPDTPDTGNGTPPIVDMGAYEFPGISLITGDFCGDNFTDPDGYVDVWDLMQFADQWHTDTGDSNWDAKFDLAGPDFGDLDAYVDVWDLMVFADNWHEGQKP